MGNQATDDDIGSILARFATRTSAEDLFNEQVLATQSSLVDSMSGIQENVSAQASNSDRHALPPHDFQPSKIYNIYDVHDESGDYPVSVDYLITSAARICGASEEQLRLRLSAIEEDMARLQESPRLRTVVANCSAP